MDVVDVVRSFGSGGSLVLWLVGSLPFFLWALWFFGSVVRGLVRFLACRFLGSLDLWLILSLAHSLFGSSAHRLVGSWGRTENDSLLAGASDLWSGQPLVMRQLLGQSTKQVTVPYECVTHCGAMQMCPGINTQKLPFLSLVGSLARWLVGSHLFLH